MSLKPYFIDEGMQLYLGDFREIVHRLAQQELLVTP